MKPRCVLVVDDEPFICRSLSFVLRKGNYNVVEARNGEEALAAARDAADGGADEREIGTPVTVYVTKVLTDEGRDAVRELAALLDGGQ